MNTSANNINLEVLFDMLNNTDSNYSYFAASRITHVAHLLTIKGANLELKTMIDRLVELRRLNKLEDDSNELLDQCINNYTRKD
jgi:hypothetical protein